jgi:ABC-type sugar transport system ATPase subunit
VKEDILLEVKDVSKNFPGVQALDNVSLTLKRGTIHALCGENGAGKSTLMHILMGVYRKDEGEIFFKNQPVDFYSPRQALLSKFTKLIIIWTVEERDCQARLK